MFSLFIADGSTTNITHYTLLSVIDHIINRDESKMRDCTADSRLPS